MTIESTGNAKTFGDYISNSMETGASDATRGVLVEESTPGPSTDQFNIITIQHLGNARRFWGFK